MNAPENARRKDTLELRHQKTIIEGRASESMRELKLREARAVDIQRQEECLVTTVYEMWRRPQAISRKFQSVVRHKQVGPLCDAVAEHIASSGASV